MYCIGVFRLLFRCCVDYWPTIEMYLGMLCGTLQVKSPTVDESPILGISGVFTAFFRSTITLMCSRRIMGTRQIWYVIQTQSLKTFHQFKTGIKWLIMLINIILFPDLMVFVSSYVLNTRFNRTIEHFATISVWPRLNSSSLQTFLIVDASSTRAMILKWLLWGWFTRFWSITERNNNNNNKKEELTEYTQYSYL